MARIPRPEIDRIKSEVSLQRLVEVSGIELKRHGAKDLVGRCPFHNDRTPSLVITPGTNEWHCMGACNEGGDVIRWVMKTRGVSFPHAVALLKADHPSLAKTRLKVKRDDSFRRFEQYLKEQQPAKPNVYCQNCPKYQVTADFTGRLDVAASAGLKRDPTTGQAVGVEGFGHPLPFSQFRLVVTEISNVAAKEVSSQYGCAITRRPRAVLVDRVWDCFPTELPRGNRTAKHKPPVELFRSHCESTGSRWLTKPEQSGAVAPAVND